MLLYLGDVMDEVIEVKVARTHQDPFLRDMKVKLEPAHLLEKKV
jgi:hypothetical protein